MERTVLIPEYELHALEKELKELRAVKTAKISVNYSEYSIYHGGPAMWYAEADENTLKRWIVEVCQSLDDHIKRLNAEAVALQKLRDEQKHVPRWIVWLFNRKSP